MTQFETPNIIDELTTQARVRMDADPAFRRRVFQTVGDDPSVLECLLRRLKDGSISLDAKQLALETLEEMELDELDPGTQAALRDVLLAAGYVELHAIAARILAGHGAAAAESPGMTAALTAVAENPAESAAARRWAIASLATIARGSREVRLALSRVARGNVPEGVRYEAEHALVFGSSILSNWIQAVSQQPLIRSALLHEIADRGVDGYLPHITPRQASPSVGLSGSIHSTAAGAAIAHVLPAASYSPDTRGTAPAAPSPSPGSLARNRSMNKPKPVDKGETSGLNWELTLLPSGRCRLAITSHSDDPNGVVYQVFENGTEYPQRYGFMGYVLMRPDLATPGVSFGALEWDASSLPDSPSWVFHAMHRGSLSDQDLAILGNMPQIAAGIDPAAAPLWQQWLTESEPSDADEFE